MAASAQRSIGTSATALGNSQANEYIHVRNTGGVSVFVGGSGVTTGNGFELLPGAAFGVDTIPAERLYGVVASGTVRVDEITVSRV